ncbi:MAG: cyclic-di-AMP receptor [Chloroflexota bacterium]
MKLLVAFVQEADAVAVSEDLRTNGHRFTRIPSVGGFLEEANSTFVLAVADEHMDDVLASFERSSQAREVEMPVSLRERLEDWRARTVRHGGATILITDLERIHQT